LTENKSLWVHSTAAESRSGLQVSWFGQAIRKDKAQVEWEGFLVVLTPFLCLVQPPLGLVVE
jgi:hypothetical protein